jgi:hypothetical protein
MIEVSGFAADITMFFRNNVANSISDLKANNIAAAPKSKLKLQ